MLPLWTPKRTKRPEPPPPASGYLAPKPKEMLSGKVQGKKASDIEERSAISINRSGYAFNFRARLVPVIQQPEHKTKIQQRFSPEEERAQVLYDIVTYLISVPGVLEVDFLVFWRGCLLPILVDGEYAHFKSPAQVNEDKAKEDAITIALSAYNAMPILRVKFDQLQTQEDSDTYYKRALA